MASLASPTTRNEVAVLQADVPPFAPPCDGPFNVPSNAPSNDGSDAFDPIHFEAHLKDHADWAELIEIVRSANELARLARALLPAPA